MSIEQLAKKSEVELANIKGIEQNKAIELATVSKLYLELLFMSISLATLSFYRFFPKKFRK